MSKIFSFRLFYFGRVLMMSVALIFLCNTLIVWPVDGNCSSCRVDSETKTSVGKTKSISPRKRRRQNKRTLLKKIRKNNQLKKKHKGSKNFFNLLKKFKAMAVPAIAMAGALTTVCGVAGLAAIWFGSISFGCGSPAAAMGMLFLLTSSAVTAVGAIVTSVFGFFAHRKFKRDRAAELSVATDESCADLDDAVEDCLVTAAE